MFVLYLDMLGFSELVLAHPSSLILEIDAQQSFTSVYSSPSASLFSRFHSVLDQVLENRFDTGPSSAMVFSDCVFLVYENALLAAVHSTGLLRHFVKAFVPVRMGLGYGTCNAVRFTSDTLGTFNLTRAVFSGSGVVQSHRAEKCGEKGCRIFVHPSVGGFLDEIRRRVSVLPLARQTPSAHWELGYLHEDGPVTNDEPSAATKDKELERAVKRMRDNSEPMSQSVSVQYTDTLAALERMRVHMGRPILIDS
jgi:hypothetical protein